MKLTIADITKQKDVLEKCVHQGRFTNGVIKWLDLEEDEYRTLVLFAGDEPVTLLSARRQGTSWSVALIETGSLYRRQYYGVAALLYLFDFQSVRQVPTGEKPCAEKAVANRIIEGEATWDSVKFWRHIGADVDDSDTDMITFRLPFEKFSNYLGHSVTPTSIFS